MKTEDVKKTLSALSESDDLVSMGFRMGLQFALTLINKIDEPETAPNNKRTRRASEKPHGDIDDPETLTAELAKKFGTNE